jgi:hypothetical protein
LTSWMNFSRETVNYGLNFLVNNKMVNEYLAILERCDGMLKWCFYFMDGWQDLYPVCTQSVQVKLGDIYKKVNTLLKMNVPGKFIFACIHRDQCLLVRYIMYLHTHLYNTGTMNRSTARLTDPTTKNIFHLLYTFPELN